MNKTNQHIIRRYKDCAEAGMSKAETGRHLGVHRSQVHRMSLNHGISFSTDLDGMTTDQLADHEVLCAKGGYSADEAYRIVMAEKVKIRLGVPA